MQPLVFDPELISRYDIAGPRYTSYPTAVQFDENLDEARYREIASASNDDPIPRPLSLYVHIPFCRQLCYYCGCTKKVTRRPETIRAYLKSLYREVAIQGELFDADRRVEQLHWGGGTPTYLAARQMTGLMEQLDKYFSLPRDEDREFSIEVDPRTVDGDTIRLLAELGFNRMSIGVQDLDIAVQQAVNRVQSAEQTLGLVSQAQQAGFRGVSVDLIYGLPLQTRESFGRTLDQIIGAKPARIAAYSYAHLPQLFRAQRLIRTEDLPSAEEKLGLLELIIERLTEAGYVYVGMDHFALPDDELIEAQKQGHLQRNFQGYSTRSPCDLVGLGMSAIGAIGDSYSQNAKTLPAYNAALDSNRLPIWRGIELSEGDRLRRTVIQTLMCHGRVDFAPLERRYAIEFQRYFATELARLTVLEADGLVSVDDQGFQVTARGRLLLRIVAMVFDAYLNGEAAQRFSRVI